MDLTFLLILFGFFKTIFGLTSLGLGLLGMIGFSLASGANLRHAAKGSLYFHRLVLSMSLPIFGQPLDHPRSRGCSWLFKVIACHGVVLQRM